MLLRCICFAGLKQQRKAACFLPAPGTKDCANVSLGSREGKQWDQTKAVQILPSPLSGNFTLTSRSAQPEGGSCSAEDQHLWVHPVHHPGSIEGLTDKCPAVRLSVGAEEEAGPGLRADSGEPNHFVSRAAASLRSTECKQARLVYRCSI